MGSIRTIENIAKLVKTSVTTLSLPASRLNIGSFQYNTAALTLNTAVTGVGGCDVAVAANSVYYTYAVVSSNVVYLIASLSSSLPAGFTQARKVGAFTTGATSQILEAFYYGQGAIADDWQNYTPTCSWTSNTTTSGKYRRDGSNLKCCVGVFLSGAPNSASLTLSIPTGLTIAVNDAMFSVHISDPIGSGSLRDYGSTAYELGVGYSSTTAVVVSCLDASAAYTKRFNAVSDTAPTTVGATDQIHIKFTVPIVEWAGSGTQFVW